jgi:DNA invertase Pin-like site-specific DNA recombinase
MAVGYARVSTEQQELTLSVMACMRVVSAMIGSMWIMV